jgi:NAD+ synthase
MTKTNPAEVSESIVNWLADYATRFNLNSFVVGVSGGVDSGAVCRLSQKAATRPSCTAKRVIAVAMPMAEAHDSASGSLYRAMELCVGQPNVEFHIRPIGRILAAYIGEGVGNDPDNLLLQGNLRSRIRANILADFAGANKGIVVGTGNEDEDEIGYFTKWGDGAVDVCPMSKIHKSMVRQIARLLDVPQSIIDVAPTAGLWNGQTDEGELGMTYDEVEWAIEHDKLPLSERPACCQEPALKDVRSDLTDRQKIVLSKVRHMRRINAHKLAYPPVCDPLG